jgi:hypothetical protein
MVFWDGVTRLEIQGVGIIKCQVGDHILSVDGIRYIPDLAESIYNLFLYISCPSHGLYLLLIVDSLSRILYQGYYR